MSNETFRPLGYLSVIKLSRSLTAIYPPCYLTTVSPLGDVVSNKVKEELHTSGLFGTPKTAYIRHWQAMLVGGAPRLWWRNREGELYGGHSPSWMHGLCGH